MNNSEGGARPSGHPLLEFWERYERVLDKLEKNQRNVENHWKQLMRRMIEYEEKKHEQPQEQTEGSGPAGQ